ncbi:MAG: tetratricopeptide repeat-containing glycosyltransferase family protein [Proteobacteria bacterium]|nr:tetratricopeptide repeat-containing glycosyltransferase family protein [Pseudomonadota bacterium]
MATQAQRDRSTGSDSLREAARLFKAGRGRDAAVVCAKIVAADPGNASALHLLGAIRFSLGDAAAGLELIDRAIEGKSDDPSFHCNRANILNRLRRFDEAVESCDRALALKPDYPDVYANLSNALRGLGRLDESVAAARKAIALRPGYVEAHNLLANSLKAEGRIEEALPIFDRVIAAQPENAGAHFNRALALLLAGRFEEGWREYEWRWRWQEFPSARPPKAVPLWDGKPREGGTLLLWGEQGGGDTIQFVRYAPLVRRHCARVVLAVRREIMGLMASAPGVDQVVDRDRYDEAGEDFAACVPLLSLPRLMGTPTKTIPAETPYLSAPEESVTRWRERLSKTRDHKTGGRKIGLVWSGNPKHANDHHRSCRLADMAPLARIEGAHFYALQIGEPAAHADAPPDGMTIERLDGVLGDFAELAAAVSTLNLIVTVDTAPAHLAGALGRPVWTALPFSPDWRWQRTREDSPWYPSMRLFRQASPGAWTGVFERMAAAFAGEKG